MSSMNGQVYFSNKRILSPKKFKKKITKKKRKVQMREADFIEFWDETAQ